MSTLRKQQKDELVEQLDTNLFRPIYLRCDGYLVQASIERHKNKLNITVYVNGYLKGIWFNDGHEESKRFWRHSTKNKWGPKFIKTMEKVIGKRECKKKGYYDKHTDRSPFWNRPRPFINHVVKHNESVAVLDYDTYKAELEKLQEKDNG